MRPKTHAKLVASLVSSGRGRVQTRNFHRTFFPALFMNEEPDYAEKEELDVDWLRGIFPFVPDAYRIDPERRLLTLYEVEVTYQVPHHKLLRMASAAMHFFVLQWQTKIILVDRYGRRREEPWYPLMVAATKKCG